MLVVVSRLTCHPWGSGVIWLPGNRKNYEGEQIGLQRLDYNRGGPGVQRRKGGVKQKEEGEAVTSPTIRSDDACNLGRIRISLVERTGHNIPASSSRLSGSLVLVRFPEGLFVVCG